MTGAEPPDPRGVVALQQLLVDLGADAVGLVLVDVLSRRGAYIDDVAPQVAAIVERLHVYGHVPGGLPPWARDLPLQPLACGCLPRNVEQHGHVHRRTRRRDPRDGG